MKAIEEVLDSNHYILGEKVRLFEEQFAHITGCAQSAGVANGTEALVLALRALGVRPGDEVITVSHTATGTVAAIEQAGAIPVLADIDPVSHCLDPGSIEHLFSKKTKVLLPVHIYGHPAEMDKILEIASDRGINVIEDCAQANGAVYHSRKTGSMGHAAAFSFYPTKNIGALGDGGAVTSNDPSVIEKVRLLREYGFGITRHVSEIPGINSRLDEVQAAVLLVRLKYFKADMARRASIANYYLNELCEVPSVVLPGIGKNIIHAFHLFVIECDERDDLANYMDNHGIMTARHYPLPVHLQPAYVGRFRGSDDLPVTKRFYKRLLTLPLYPELTDDQINYICRVIKSWKS